MRKVKVVHLFDGHARGLTNLVEVGRPAATKKYSAEPRLRPIECKYDDGARRRIRDMNDEVTSSRSWHPVVGHPVSMPLIRAWSSPVDRI